MRREMQIERTERTERTEERRDEMNSKTPVLELDVEVLEERIAPADACCTLY